MNKTYNSIIIPSPEVFTRGGYIAPKIRGVKVVERCSLCTGSREASAGTEDYINGGDDLVIF